jgi:citrate synthase
VLVVSSRSSGLRDGQRRLFFPLRTNKVADRFFFGNCSLPPYACRFLEMALQLTADHGPAVSGAMNTVITTRAGKDLVSSLVAGLLTIGDRFGGALDGAAAEFTRAYDSGLSPREFVDSMRRANKLSTSVQC